MGIELIAQLRQELGETQTDLRRALGEQTKLRKVFTELLEKKKALQAKLDNRNQGTGVAPGRVAEAQALLLESFTSLELAQQKVRAVSDLLVEARAIGQGSGDTFELEKRLQAATQESADRQRLWRRPSSRLPTSKVVWPKVRAL